jgi:primosomal protein N' (replication factor Y) (superfamily II helicase)
MKFADLCLGVPVDQNFTYSIPEDISVAPGMRVHVPFGRRKETGYVIRVHDDVPREFAAKDIIECYDDAPVFDERLVDLCRYTSSFYVCSLGEAMSAALPSGKSSGTRSKKKSYDRMRNVSDISLTGEQSAAVQGILEDKINSSHLLYGVTGSGKTEVYLSLVRKMIDEGKSVIILVPEISLSAHIFRRFEEYFGDTLVLYHSALSPNQRLSNWMKFYSGEARVVVGTRSAVFLQCPSLGLIVIDEEHDGSYKEHSTPRYNARRIAMKRVKDEKALLVLGSATPSIETMYAAKSGALGMHSLKNRYMNTPMPTIELIAVDGRHDDDIISTELKIAVKHAVDDGRQAIFLLNRRGFAPIVMCRACSQKIECPHCSISMNFHRDGSLLCHYCGYTIRNPDVCPACGSDDIAKIGTGTQRIEQIIEKQLSSFRVFRLDQDAVRTKDASYDLIDKMKNGDIDILLGTQMVSKGFDFGKVDVVGVILADIGMSLPDFRASERIFSLLMQVAGRCGRSDRRGRVIVQTLSVENELLQLIQHHDYESFYEREIELRKMLLYPPFSRIARFLLRGADEKKVCDAARAVADEVLLATKGSSVPVLGPSPAPLAKIGGNYRYHLIVKSRDSEMLINLARRIRTFYSKSDPYLEIDIDPFEML